MRTACARCGGQLEEGDLRCPLCGLALPTEVGPGSALERPRAQVVRCSGCGASVEYSVEAQAPRCAFCASVMRVETAADPLEQAEAFVPFGVEPEAARSALHGFLAHQGFFRPGDLAAEAAIESLQPLWWPAWAFRAGARVSWTADSEVGSGRSSWAPHAGQAELTFHDLLVSASRGLTLGECSRLAGAYDLSVAEAALRGEPQALVERFDVTRSGARRQIAAAAEAQAREQVSHTCVPGQRKRNVHVAVVLSRLETRRYALPAYVLAYRYGKKLYRVVVHGQDARVVLGDAPLSWVRILAVAGAVLLGVLGVIALLKR